MPIIIVSPVSELAGSRKPPITGYNAAQKSNPTSTNTIINVRSRIMMSLLLASKFLLRDPQDVILYLDLVSRELRFNLLLELRHRRRAVLAVESARVVHQNHVLIS